MDEWIETKTEQGLSQWHRDLPNGRLIVSFVAEDRPLNECRNDLTYTATIIVGEKYLNIPIGMCGLEIYSKDPQLAMKKADEYIAVLANALKMSDEKIADVKDNKMTKPQTPKHLFEVTVDQIMEWGGHSDLTESKMGELFQPYRVVEDEYIKGKAALENLCINYICERIFNKRLPFYPAAWLIRNMIERAYREGCKTGDAIEKITAPYKEHSIPKGDSKEMKASKPERPDLEKNEWLNEKDLRQILRIHSRDIERLQNDIAMSDCKKCSEIENDLAEFKSTVYNYMATNDAVECVNVLYERLTEIEKALGLQKVESEVKDKPPFEVGEWVWFKGNSVAYPEGPQQIIEIDRKTVKTKECDIWRSIGRFRKITIHDKETTKPLSIIPPFKVGEYALWVNLDANSPIESGVVVKINSVEKYPDFPSGWKLACSELPVDFDETASEYDLSWFRKIVDPNEEKK